MKKVFVTRFVYDGRGFKEIQLSAENRYNSFKYYMTGDSVPNTNQLIDIIYKSMLFDSMF